MKSTEIETFIKSYIQHVDKQKADETLPFLNENFRVILNMNNELKLLDRETYLQMMKDGKVGGNNRKITFRAIYEQLTNAMIFACIESDKMQMNTFLSLLKINNNWQIVSDMPEITFK